MYKKKATAISLPLNKTAKIMNSAVGVETVNQDIVALATKATVSKLDIFILPYNSSIHLIHSSGNLPYGFRKESI